jgi:hypothetical protein
MFQKILALTLLACLILAPLPQARAADQASIPADANTQKLKALFEEFMNDQKTLAEKSGGAQFDYDGTVMIEPSDGYYAVTLPHVKVNYTDGSQIDIGMISINASAHEAGQWKMAVAIPTPLLLREKKDSAPIKINIGTQKAAGIWDESLKGFAKLDAQYGNITINQPDAPYTLAIAESQIVYDYAKNPDATWTGPGFFALRNVTINWPANKSDLKLAELKGEINLERYNPAAVDEYRKQIMASATDGATPGNALVLDQLSKLFISLGGGIKSGFTLQSLEITRPDPSTASPQTLNIKSAYAQVDATDFAAEKAGLGLKLGYDGLLINPMPKGYDGILPSSLNLDIGFNDMPLKALIDMGKTTYEATLQNPAMTQLAGMSFMMKAPAILSAAGTGLTIKDTYIGNSEYRFDLAGSAKADVAAINFATGAFKGEFKGLDGLITRVNAIAKDPTHPMAGNAAAMEQSLTTMKNSGAVKPGTESSPVYVYDLVMDTKGQILLNGKSLMGAPVKAQPRDAKTP